MPSLEIFWSACAAAADYRQIRCRVADRQYRRQHPKTFSTNIITLHNSVQVNVKFRVRKKGLIYFIFYICVKRTELNLSTNLPMFFDTFQAMWRHRPLEEYLVFVGIRDAHTSFSPFTLGSLTYLACIESKKTRCLPCKLTIRQQTTSAKAQTTSVVTIVKYLNFENWKWRGYGEIQEEFSLALVQGIRFQILVCPLI